MQKARHPAGLFRVVWPQMRRARPQSAGGQAFGQSVA